MKPDIKNQIEQTNFIKNKFSKYLKSTFDIRNKTYRDLYIQRLSELESKLYKGPYLASTLPFEPSKSINELVTEGFFHEDFLNISNLDFDRPCYKHQINSFERIKEGRNIVVTTGTGSGKTECFMLPILNDLIEELQNGTIESGVRVIFLFPLNALVYDQIDRLREYLKNYSDIKFGFYTGRTPESSKSPEGKKQIASYKAKFGEPIKNELITREEMRENPPQILFTNYSMLEYLLIRPSDEKLISQQALNHLKYIVLDEAHIYRGSLGIEISLLLRRLMGLANKKPQFVLTSATLGRGKEDMEQILEFASNLTSSKYESKDVIFASRIENINEEEYRISPEDYTGLFENISNIEIFKEIFEKYIKFDDSLSINQNIYNLLSKDGNTKDFYHKTKNVGNFFDVLNTMYDFNVERLTSLIELISKASSVTGLKLFDVKYHMFMKAPDGAFITLGKYKDLSLLTVNKINGYKAFKIGICQNCKIPYVMGITENDYLCIDDEIDIDESYADKAKRLEYYLIADCLTEEEKLALDKDDNFVKYNVCTKCGFIKKVKDPVSTSDCEHFNENKTILYKYVGKEESELDEDDVVTNNIHRCPICEYKSNAGGVIMGFHVGKDRATTLISQILYESMKYPMIKVKSKKTLFNSTTTETYKLGRKQFLVFSDSRQQAAFFTKFLNSNNDKFLKKTLMWEIVEESNHNPIKFKTVIDLLDDKFKTKLHYSDEESLKHSKATALWELMLVDGRNSGEGVGLYAFKLNLNTENYMDDEALEMGLESLGFAGITAQQFRDATAQVFTIFRKSPAIEYGVLDTSDYEERKELLGYRQRKTYIKLQNIKTKTSKGFAVDKTKIPVISFLPAKDPVTGKSGRNNAVKYIEKAFNLSTDKAKELLELIFNTAISEQILTEITDPLYHDTYVINSSMYSLYGYKNLKYYKCKKCNKLTLYNVNNKCTEADCDGELECCNVVEDEYYLNNYYRNEYITRPVEYLECREHTAQMNAEEAKKIQDDFKDEYGKINFISCSTTFEMGIDLGGLNTVFMRNVPPTPANYAQRAGRAGRRAETSAFILTFCGSSSHDYTYFSNPQEMIRGLVKPPYFVIDNEKIIMRHITATALSLFFREPQYQDEFDSVEHFLDNDVKDKFLDFIKSKPTKLGNAIDSYILTDSNLKNKYGNFKWIEYLSSSESSLNLMEEGLKGLIQLYKDAEDYASSISDYTLAKSYKTARERLNTTNSLITYFTKYNVIPGYGFPVDNVELYIYNYDKQEMNEEYNLSRNLSIAISEYAPGSEIIVDERKYTSRYLFLPYTNYSLPTTYYCECNKCHTINTHKDKNHFIPGVTCKYCSSPLPTSDVKHYITPIYGFVADRQNKDTRRMKPFKTYASDIYYIGDNIQTAVSGDVVKVTEHANEELLILNDNNFYMCPICGYTDLDKRNQFPKKTLEHREYRGKECSCSKNSNNLKRIHLGHSYHTDIVQVSFNGITEMKDEDTAISVLYAILEGISMTYDIERNDIGGIIYNPTGFNAYSLILFDTVAGGSGHVKRLTNDKSLIEVLKNALRKVSQDCCAEDTSCYNCLRTYNNQRLHKHIVRGLAKKALSTIIDKILTNNKKYVIQGSALSFGGITLNDFINFGYIDDSDSRNCILSLFKEIELQKCSIPNGYGFILKSNSDSDIITADFAWVDKKILLFSIENIESYNKMISTQNEFECILLTDSLDFVELVNKIRG